MDWFLYDRDLRHEGFNLILLYLTLNMFMLAGNEYFFNQFHGMLHFYTPPPLKKMSENLWFVRGTEIDYWREMVKSHCVRNLFLNIFLLNKQGVKRRVLN